MLNKGTGVYVCRYPPSGELLLPFLETSLRIVERFRNALDRYRKSEALSSIAFHWSAFTPTYSPVRLVFRWR